MEKVLVSGETLPRGGDLRPRLGLVDNANASAAVRRLDREPPSQWSQIDRRKVGPLMAG
jgi:hypothetical protein